LSFGVWVFRPPSPESITPGRWLWIPGPAHSNSALADLDIQVPISGKPEIGAVPE
jgi:hypothetical protein